jgi:hypothetical protein
VKLAGVLLHTLTHVVALVDGAKLVACMYRSSPHIHEYLETCVHTSTNCDGVCHAQIVDFFQIGCRIA